MRKFFRERKLLVLVVSYLFFAWIVAGDGGAPIAILLVVGRANEWRLGQVIGWGTLVAGVLVHSRMLSIPLQRKTLDLVLALGLYASWLAFVLASNVDKSWVSTWIFHSVLGLPFQIAFAALVIDHFYPAKTG